MSFLFRLFDPTGFPARWSCGPGWSESPWVGWLHILSDLGIWSAYFAIPVVLIYFATRRKDLPFRGIFLLFGAFILLCGLTHLVDAAIFWWPIYRFAGVLKFVTAIVSWVTVLSLVPIVPRVLGMRAPEELEREIAARQKAETELQQINLALEERVAERTRELSQALTDLNAERELLQTTLASIGDAVIATDTDSCVTFLNSVAQDLTGWSTEAARGVPLEQVFQIVNETTRAKVDNPALRALREGVIVGLANHTILIAKDGSERPIDDSAAPIRDARGKIAGAVLVFRDITERKQQENELRQAHAQLEQRVGERTAALTANNRFLQALLDSVQVGIVACNERGELTLFNQATRAFHGLPATAVAPEQLAEHYDLFHSDGTTRLAVDEIPLIRALRGEQLADVEMVIAPKEGKVRTLIASGKDFRDDQGHLLGAVVAMHDISDRKQAEAELLRINNELEEHVQRRTADLTTALNALQQSEAFSRNVFECSPDCVKVIDASGAVLQMNANGQRVMEIDDFSKLAGCPWDSFWPEAGRSAVRNAMETARAAGSARFQGACPTAKGTDRWWDVSIAPILDPSGQISRFVSVSRDVTEHRLAEEALRKSEEDFRTLADNMSQLAWMADASGALFWYNRRWYDYTGTTFEQMEGWGWQAVQDPAHLPRVVARYQHSISSGEAWEDTFPLRSASGDYRWFLSRAIPIRDDAGSIVRWFGTNTDVTEQRKMADELRQLAANLSEADRRKDEFLATLAHELRNPLAPISNGLQVLKIAGDDAESSEETRTMMERQLAQMVRLVDDLMDVSRITRNKLELRPAKIELRDVIHNAVETSRPLIEASGHRLQVSIPEESLPITADLVRLGQVFANLLNNAAKYTERDGSIDVSVERQGSHVVVKVRDTGMGIPPNMLPRIFDMFTQVDRTLERAQGGLGIGLTLVRRLVEMHGGEVTAHSEGDDRGSEFVVRLPLFDARLAGTKVANGGTAKLTLPSTKRRILVADDNVDSATSLALMLKYMGNEVRKANDGLEAVTIAGEFLPEVIFLDIGMPKLNGFEACRRIREQSAGRQILLVALTGWGQDEDRQRSKDAGFDQHFVKPVDPQVLKKLLTESAPRQS
ncbi:PAS domain S-box protein [Anatilimnocola sp. NA78]|uniref:PAS domain-containing hybrid sensor histidine kinase/response regulator n=1 Tax=Anatilimnocola sp. NA78 TaxID=3415683 RepID=UPI003CE4A85D